MSLFTSRSVYCCFLVAAACTQLVAQQSTSALDARQKRHVITAESAQQTLVFQNLLPGETYGLLVPGGEPCLAQCMPAKSKHAGNQLQPDHTPVEICSFG